MKIVDSIAGLKSAVAQIKSESRTIGFVPTMGYLHEGHMSLVRASRRDNDITVMSIFVNPMQFGPNEDLEKYPRDIRSDSKKAEEAGVDIIFIPTVKEMYPDGFSSHVDVSGITDKLCGKSRPGHFRGVCTVVLKLFNLVEADRAYFGQKDAQQAAVIKRMTEDLNCKTEIITCPIVRESDGLAMSSRNVYLGPEERKAALILSVSLKEAREIIEGGERNARAVRDYIEGRIRSEKLADIDYVEVLDADSLEYRELLKGRMLLAVAVKFGKTRLIDNVVAEVG